RLKYKSDKLIPIKSSLFFREILHQSFCEIIFSRIILIQNSDDVEQCRFPGSGRSHDRNKFSLRYMQINAFEHFYTCKFGCIGFENVSEFYHRVGLMSKIVKNEE